MANATTQPNSRPCRQRYFLVQTEACTLLPSPRALPLGHATLQHTAPAMTRDPKSTPRLACLPVVVLIFVSIPHGCIVARLALASRQLAPFGLRSCGTLRTATHTQGNSSGGGRMAVQLVGCDGTPQFIKSNFTTRQTVSPAAWTVADMTNYLQGRATAWQQY